MKDELISFETAKLAKDKGFDIESHSYYFEDGEFKEFELNDTHGYYGEEYTVSRDEFYTNYNDAWKSTKKGNRCFGCDKNPLYLETFSSPTQSLLQRWLREKYNIHIDIHQANYAWDNKNSYFMSVYRVIDKYKNKYTSYRTKEVCSYEEALEIGLQEALKLIK